MWRSTAAPWSSTSYFESRVADRSYRSTTIRSTTTHGIRSIEVFSGSERVLALAPLPSYQDSLQLILFKHGRRWLAELAELVEHDRADWRRRSQGYEPAASIAAAAASDDDPALLPILLADGVEEEPERERAAERSTFERHVLEPIDG